ncbi:MAG: cytochrome c maturation protein CcmE, partial [Cyclobacteriaceae bacterium]
MKKGHVVGLIVIAIAVTIVITSVGDASSYVNFSEAKEMASYGNEEKIHVVGQLKKNGNGEVVGIEVSPNKLSFTFIMIDEDNHEQQVFYNEPIPADFIR